MVDPRVCFVYQPFQVLFLFGYLLWELLLPDWQFDIDDIHEYFGAAYLIGLSFDELPVLVVLQLDEGAVDAAHVLNVEVSGLSEVADDQHS